MNGKLEIKEKKLLVEIDLAQEHADVVALGCLEKAKCMVMDYIIKDHFEKQRKKEMGQIIKTGGIVH